MPKIEEANHMPDYTLTPTDNPMRNASGCKDMTAYLAIRNANRNETPTINNDSGGKPMPKRALALLRTECANYYDGECVMLDTKCPQCHSDSLICSWFRDAVLPLDKALHAELTGIGNVQKCESCQRPFKPVSNRAKYCEECAVRERKRREATRQRERYAKIHG